MKILGLLILIAGLILLGVAAYYYLGETNTQISPIPDSEGVRVIFVSPSP